MSRTNPYKKKRRSASRTLLMYGEGLGEEMFLKHLRGLYSYDSGVAVTIRNGKGGTATNIIINAVNEPGAFDRRIVILDNDKSEQEMNCARTEAREKGIELLENSPCLEATLLAILRAGQSFSGKTSTWCKREFESNYLNKKKRTELDGYSRIFPKTILETRRVHVTELNILISLMEG
ncbi:MAG: hypothetical protein Q8O53_03030 [Candidatus Moranbacteria bacterium]|nr:hypothetical protein [Candidatus Moranbacteria bacterium]